MSASGFIHILILQITPRVKEMLMDNQSENTLGIKCTAQYGKIQNKCFRDCVKIVWVEEEGRACQTLNSSITVVYFPPSLDR